MPARKVVPIVPNPARIRRIQASFAWIDHRLVRDGHLERLSLVDMAVYLFLVIVADANGVSFYRKDLISKRLGIDSDQFEEAKARLLERRWDSWRAS